MTTGARGSHASRPRARRLLLLAGLVLLGTATAHGGRLRLRSGGFDPGREPRPVVSSLAARSNPDGALLVQHRGRISPAWRGAVRAAGATILGYIPDDAYLVRGDAGLRQRLERLPGTRWVGEYRPRDRVSPQLLGAARSARSLQLRVLGFRDQPLEPLEQLAVELARRKGSALLDSGQRADGRAALLLDVPAAALADVLEQLAAQPGVEWLEPASAARPLNDAAAGICQSGDAAQTPLFQQQLTGVGQVVAVADTGVDTSACQFRFPGDAPTVFNTTQPPGAAVSDPGSKLIAYYQLQGAEAYDHDIFLLHGSRVAGSAVGDDRADPADRVAPFDAGRDSGDGMAPGAQLVVQDIGNDFGTLVGFLDQAGLHEQAYHSEVTPGIGARVHVSAYGLDPPAGYSSESSALDDTLWRLRDYTAVFAAGNWGAESPDGDPWDGSSSLAGLGAVAKNSVVVGASGNPGASEPLDTLVSESSRGPSLEGLLKPDLVAPGHNLSALGDEDPANPNCQTGRLTQLGTSFAAGVVGGMAALTRQYFTDGYYPGGSRLRGDPACEDGSCDPELFNPSNALIKALLVNSSRSLSGANTGDTNQQPCVSGCSAPSQGQGWGRVTLDDALYFAGDGRRLLLFTDTWNGTAAAANAGRGARPRGALEALETHSFAFTLAAASSEPLKLTLAWTDPAASPAAATALVNDLDLEVVYRDPAWPQSQASEVYLGNDFDPDAFVSLERGSPLSQGPDRANTLEQVRIENPPAGSYSIRVRGWNVPGNGRRDVAAEPAVENPDLIDSAQQGYALIVTGPAVEVALPPCIAATAIPPRPVGCIPLDVDFESFCGQAGNPECPPCTPSWYVWDFDDGNLLEGDGSGGEDSPSHSFQTGGRFLVDLVVRDALGLEGSLAFPIEVIAGTTDPPAAVGNSLLLRKTPQGLCPIFMTWTDVPVPDVTSYDIFQFDLKSELASLPPSGTRLNGSLLIHGQTGYCHVPQPPPAGIWHYQVRGANCVGDNGP